MWLKWEGREQNLLLKLLEFLILLLPIVFYFLLGFVSCILDSLRSICR